MSRVFNTMGSCLAEDHYMLPPGRRLSQLQDLIDGKTFFVIHAPRQTGKTTLLRNFSRELTDNGAFAAITVSMESFTDPQVQVSLPQMLARIQEVAGQQLPDELCPPGVDPASRPTQAGLTGLLSDWSRKIDRPLVVFFDEIDSLPGPVLLSVLRQLRDGYTSRPAPFPQSVALVGLKDVRDYKAQARPGAEPLGTSSPFNIKSRSLSLRNFTAAEVAELLSQHTVETGQEFAPDAVEQIFNQSGGQPWLVNALARQLVTDYDALVQDRSVTVTKEDVLAAREILIERRDTHLDSLVARLNEDRVRRVIEPILTGETSLDPTYNDDFSHVLDLGLVARHEGVHKIANAIYTEIITRVLNFQVQTHIATNPAWFVAGDGTLDMMKLIEGFIEFWRGNGEILLKGLAYQEAAPHLVFMAWLQRIVNAGGQIHREYAVGTKRVDLVVEFGGRSDVIELKRTHVYKALPDGLAQVSSYAKRLGRDRGYLVLFDVKTTTPIEERGKVETVEEQGVNVVILRV